MCIPMQRCNKLGLAKVSFIHAFTSTGFQHYIVRVRQVIVGRFGCLDTSPSDNHLSSPEYLRTLASDFNSVVLERQGEEGDGQTVRLLALSTG